MPTRGPKNKKGAFVHQDKKKRNQELLPEESCSEFGIGLFILGNCFALIITFATLMIALDPHEGNFYDFCFLFYTFTFIFLISPS